VAGYAPLHLKRVFLKDRGHIVHLPVAGRTSHAFGNVNAVIEVCVFRQIVYPLPLDWFVVAKAGPHRFEIGTVSPDLAVAVHACLGGGHACGSRCLNGLMAVTAVDAVIADVVFMAELNRLLPLEIAAR